MRTTLSIDDDVLLATKELARQQRRTAGQVLSDLAREALNHRCRAATEDAPAGVLGFVPFRDLEGRPVTNEMVDQIRDKDGI